ncbi:MAG: DUF2061 domain-containing protein [Acidobacteriota bacterium]
MKETRTRSLMKAISWRVIATCITISIAYLFTKRLDVALEIGGLDMFIKLFAYFLHERFWGKVKVGKVLHPLADIRLKKDLNGEEKRIIKEKLKELGYLNEQY